MKIESGECSDLQVLLERVDIEGLDVVDVGCGKGEFASDLASLGARVTGVEPDAQQAARNRAAEPLSGLNLVEAGAQDLPLDDASQDLVIFRFSLHHIPGELYPDVFREVARVLRPGARLYVIEPLAEGSSQWVMELFHDETKVRARAQQALQDGTQENFNHVATLTYQVVRDYPDFAAYVKRYAHLSYNSYTVDSVDHPRVRERFEQFQQDDGSVSLVQPVKADLFTRRAKEL